MRLGSIALASALTVAAASANAARIEGSFDGLCDGFSLTTNDDGAVYGVETGCEDGPIAGRWVAKFKKGSGGEGVAASMDHLLGPIFEINTEFHTYAIYKSDGTIMESGTWSETAQRQANRNLRASGRKSRD